MLLWITSFFSKNLHSLLFSISPFLLVIASSLSSNCKIHFKKGKKNHLTLSLFFWKIKGNLFRSRHWKWHFRVSLTSTWQQTNPLNGWLTTREREGPLFVSEVPSTSLWFRFWWHLLAPRQKEFVLGKPEVNQSPRGIAKTHHLAKNQFEKSYSIGFDSLLTRGSFAKKKL